MTVINPEPSPTPPPPLEPQVDPAPEWDLEQLASAKVITGTVIQAGGIFWDIVLALACAMQESSLRNLPGGDKDSIGLFQQRPSQGWGEPYQLNDPVYATEAFLNGTPNTAPGLFGHPERYSVPLTDAIQAVQQSDFPDAYAKWQIAAVALATLMTGGSDVPAFPNAPVPYKWQSARWYSTGRPQGLDFIVVHDVEATLANGVAQNVADFFSGPGDPGNPTSAHAVVGPDLVVEQVKPMDTAWHCANGNQRGYGIEQCGFASFTRAQWTNALAMQQMNNFAWWAAGIAKEYGIPARWLTDAQLATPGVKGFCTHADVTRVLGGTDHTDPGPNYPRDLLMKAVVNQMSGPTPPPAQGVFMALTDDEQQELLKLARLIGGAVALPNDGGPAVKQPYPTKSYTIPGGNGKTRADIAAQSKWLQANFQLLAEQIQALTDTVSALTKPVSK